MDQEKLNYLKENGYFEVTKDFVIGYHVGTWPSPKEKALEKAIEFANRKNFIYAKMMEQQEVCFYSKEYLENTPLEELQKACERHQYFYCENENMETE